MNNELFKKLYQQEVMLESERGVPDSSEYKKALAAVREMENKLTRGMTPEQKAMYEAYDAKRSALELLDEERWFKRGFCLGFELCEEMKDGAEK